MDEQEQNYSDLQPQQQATTSTQTEVKRDVAIDPKTDTRFDDLPNLEDLLKSEKDVKVEVDSTPQGLKQVKQNEKPADKIFTRKEDQKRAFIKHRVKLFTSIYAIVCCLLLGLVGFNAATLIAKNRDINSQTDIIQQGNTYLGNSQSSMEDDNVLELPVTVNTPRDYGDDANNLTFFDRLTILFRSLFS